jgi:hypothetical protein
MSQRLLNLRVRPPRVVVLVNLTATDADLLLAFEFFSKIWGGRFGQLLAVDPKASDSLAEFRLARSRPEFIYGLGVDDGYWRKVVHNVCQPRKYDNLSADYVRTIKNSSPRSKDYYLVDHALLHLYETRDRSKGQKQQLRLVSPSKDTALAVYCGAMFGIHHQDLRKDLFDAESTFSGTKATEFVDLSTEFVKEWHQSWLDVTAHELVPQLTETGPLAPTVVLVGSKAPDLALFWNLRSGTDARHLPWIIPVPVEMVNEPGLLDKLKNWLLEFLPYGRRPNYCHVTSQTVEEEVCRQFADQFQAALAGSPIESVEFEPPHNRLPLVVPYEYLTTWPVEINGRRLTIVPPKPKAFEQLTTSRAWFVDLLDDAKTGRAVKELQLPPSLVMVELLNGPCPPHFEKSATLRVGDGPDSINLRCSGTKEVINLYLPTREEVLGEILHEHGIEPLPDEKRSSYLPVIRRFGGLYMAAAAFAGESGMILTALANGPMTLAEIQGKCKLGRGQLSGKTYLERIDWMLKPESERMKRIARHRYTEYAKQSEPENVKLWSLLEYWADRSVLSRSWKIGPCRRCSQQHYVASLNIQRRILCPNCGHKISLPAAVPIGYTLQGPVARAIQEGIVPVAQTGRFLQAMTNQGFLWRPGVKYKIGDQCGDLDLMACCDGHLVFCECKNLDETPGDAKLWAEVVGQFLETARIAKLCGGSLAVLACKAVAYPQDVIDRLATELGTSIPYLLLTKEDLDKGYRQFKQDTLTSHVMLHDLLPIPFSEKPRDRVGKPRTIDMGWAVYTS